MASGDKTIKLSVMLDGREHFVKDTDEISNHIKAFADEVKVLDDKLKKLAEEKDKIVGDGSRALTDAEQLRVHAIDSEMAQTNDAITKTNLAIRSLTTQLKDLRAMQSNLADIANRTPDTISQARKDRNALIKQYEKRGDTFNEKDLEMFMYALGRTNAMLREYDENVKKVGMSSEQLKKVLADMADPNVGASMNSLNAASKELQRQLSQMSPQNGKYAETAENYRKVTEEIKRQKEELKGVSGTEQEVTQSILRQIEARKAAAAAVGKEVAEEKKEFETIDEIFVKYHKLNEEIARLKDLESKGNATIQDVQMIKKLNQEAGEYEATISLIHEEEGEVKTARLKTLVDDLKAASDKMEQYKSEMVSKYGNGRPSEQFWDVSEKMTDEENEKWSQLNKVIEQAQGALKGFKLTEEEVAALDVVPVEEVEAVKDATLSMQNLERAMKFLKDEGNKLEIGSPEWEDNQKKIEEIKKLKEELAGTKKELIDIDELRSRIPDASLDELKAAKNQLSEQFGGMKKGDTGYDQTIEDIKAIDAQIKVVQDSLNGVKAETVDVDDVLRKIAQAEEERKSVSVSATNEETAALEEQLNTLRELYKKKQELDARDRESTEGPIVLSSSEAIDADVDYETALDEYQKTGTALDGLVEKYREAKAAFDEFSESYNVLEASDEGNKKWTELEDAVERAKDAIGNFDANIEVNTDGIDDAIVTTKKLKLAEEELKKQLRDNKLTEEDRVKTSKKLSTVQQELARREKIVSDETKRAAQAAKDAEIGYSGYAGVLNNIKGSTLPQMKRAVEDMTKELEKLPRGSKEFKEMAYQIAQVKNAINGSTSAMKEHASKIQQVIDRLKTYVMVYLSFAKFLDLMKEFRGEILALSDSIADIQKVTKMTADEVDNLSRAIDRIDSRSSQEALHQLAYQAGLMGLSAQNDILGFVRAADQMNWALKELGEDGAVQLMKVANLTHEVEKYGVETALKKVGSAINEITANSAASAGPVTDIVSRLGSVGSACNYASHELVAIGSTLNALGVQSERGATAVNKLMIALNNNTGNIAYKLGIDGDTIKNLQEQGKSMEAMILVLEKLNSMGGANNTMEALGPIFKDLGGEGTRLISTLTTLVEHVDTLKEHVGITAEAFDEGVSMLNEFNVKNETAAALFERMGNNIKEAFINSSLTRALQEIAASLERVTAGMSRWNAVLRPIATLLKAGLGVYALVKGITGLIAAVKFVNIQLRMKYLALLDNNKATMINTLLTEAKTKADVEAALAIRAEETSLRALWAAMIANPLTATIALLTTLASIGYVVYESITNLTGGFDGLTDAEKAMQVAADESTANMTTEIAKADELGTKLIDLTKRENDLENQLKSTTLSAEDRKKKEEELNKTHTARTKLINKFNELYSPYLGYLLSEKTSMDKLELAVRAVNMALEDKAAIMLKNAQLEALDTETKKTYQQSLKDLKTDLHDITRLEALTDKQRTVFESRLAARMQTLVGQGKSTNEIYNELQKAAKDYLKEINATDTQTRHIMEAWNWKEVKEDIEMATSAYSNFVSTNKALDEEEEKTKTENATRYADNTAIGQMKEQYETMAKLRADFNKADAENRQSIAQSWINTYERFISIDAQYTEKMSQGNKTRAKQMRSALEEIKKTMVAATQVTPQGLGNGNKPGNDIKKLDDWDSEDLVDKWKKLNTEKNQIDIKNEESRRRFLAEFGREMKSEQEARDAYHDRIKEIYAVLQKRDLTAQGVVNYKEPKDKKKNVIIVDGVPMTLQEIRDAMAAGKAAIEAYYHNEGEQLRAKYIEGNLGSEQDLNNQIEALNERREISLQQFYQRLLRINEDFDVTAYGDYLKVRDWYGNITDEYEDLDQLSLFLNKMGHGMQQELMNNLEKAEENIQKIQVKHINALNKIFLQRDFVGKVDEQYKQQLTQAGLFWSSMADVNEKESKKASEKQMKVFQKIAFNADFMTTKELRAALEKEGMTEWLKDRTEKDLAALLLVLQDYNDASIEAERKHANEQRRIVTKNWEWRAELQDKELKKQQLNEKMLEQLQSAGIIREGALIQLQLDHFAQRIAYQTRLVAELQRKGANYKEEQKALNALLEEEHEKREEWLNSIRKRVLEYGDAIREISESIASAGAGHANFTSLAEIEAKKRLGIAIDTTKQEYLIYSQNGKAERVMLTEEEYLKKKIEIDARNERLKATSEFLKKLGEKWSEEFTQQINSQMALARQREIEQQMTEFKNNAGETRFLNAQSWMTQELNFATSWAGQMNQVMNGAYKFGNFGNVGNVGVGGQSGTGSASTESGGGATGFVPTFSGGGDAAGGNVMQLDMSVFKPIEAKDLMNMDDINNGFNQMKDASKAASQSMSSDIQQASQTMTSSINLFGTAFAATMNENADAASVFGSLFIQYIGDALIKTLAASFVNTSGKMTFNMAEGITKVWGQLGIWGMLGVPLITAAFGSAMGLASRALTKSQSEISALTGAASGKKVAAGMLTYAEGNYPVLGSDGEVYDAKRETNWKTKVYSSPHYGILGEKGPELIVDGVTTRKMMTLRPDLYQDILALAHGRQAVRAKAYAEGNYPAMPAENAAGTVAGDTNAMLVAAISQLNAQLAGGIKVAALGEDGAVRRLNEAEEWMRKHGLA